MRLRPYLLALPLLAACAHLPMGIKHAPGTELAWKQVVDKREPAYLIATDGTTCTVDPGRFAKTEVGKSVLCAWQ